MDILILGNGFDLAHDLDTKYEHFLNYCTRNQNVGNIWLRHFINKKNKQEIHGDKWIDLEKEIYEVVKELNNRLKYLTNNYNKEFILKTYSFQKDCFDYEFDLSKITNKLIQSPNKYPTGEEEYVSIKTNVTNLVCYYFKTYKGLINFLYDQLRDFTNQFNDYLLMSVLPNIGNKKFNLKSLDSEAIRILNFNYTNTYEKLYTPNIIYDDSYLKYIYVHGKVCNTNNCNLILGTHSFYNYLPNNLDEEINVEFNIFKKHNQRHKYGTIELYQELLNEIKKLEEESIIKFHVIGHSLDIADHTILRHIFQANKNSVINIYFHNQEALNRLINNITEIIGEEEVMAKVRFIAQDDPNRGILIPQ